MFNIYNIVFTLKARYDLNCVKSAVKPQPTFASLHAVLFINTVIIFVNTELFVLSGGCFLLISYYNLPMALNPEIQLGHK